MQYYDEEEEEGVESGISEQWDGWEGEKKYVVKGVDINNMNDRTLYCFK
jgi:hypothetical protein